MGKNNLNFGLMNPYKIAIAQIKIICLRMVILLAKIKI